MKSVVTAFGKFKGGRVVLDNEWLYRDELKALKAKDGAALIVKVSRATRSDKANAYLWGVVYPAIVEGSESGYTDVELHEVYCEMFLPTEQKQVEFFSRLTGEVLTVATKRRSSDLSGAPFYDFVEAIREHARTFFGVETPDPDPSYWRKKTDVSIEQCSSPVQEGHAEVDPRRRRPHAARCRGHVPDRALPGAARA
jgi:hypothetical protein